MIDYTIHTVDTAPEAARATLAEARKAYGFVPNMFGIMAEAPGLLNAYLTLNSLFENGTLTPVEQQVVLLAVSFENRCEYCMGAHTVIAAMKQVPEAVIAALREGAPIDDRRLEALRRLAASMVARRGFPEQAAVREFLDAGYTRGQLLEVILGVGIKTLSNYTNHNANTPLDEAFSNASWNCPGNGTAT